MRAVKGPDGKPVTVNKIASRGPHKGETVKVPLRKPVKDRQGKTVYVESAKWAIEYSDAEGRIRTAGGFRDKSAAQLKMAEIVRAVEQQRAGIVSVAYEHGEKPVANHVADWIADLTRAGRSRAYTRNIKSRVGRLRADLGWTKLSSIRSDTLSRWLSLQQRGGLSGRTINHYIEAAMAFCNWCVIQRRLETNPLDGFGKATSVEPTFVRRAATLEELQRFLAVPAKRALVYLTAVLTGLRRKELKLLQWGDVRFGDAPHISLRAGTTKSRRADVLPIPPELVDELRAIRPDNSKPTDRAFKSVPKSSTVQADLRRAGIELVVDGRKLDLHALRTTFGTMLATSGASIRTAMELMRHTDIRLTTRVYTDPRLLDTHGAVDRLPRIRTDRDKQRLRATGTCDVASKTPEKNIRSDIRKGVAGRGETWPDTMSSDSAAEKIRNQKTPTKIGVSNTKRLRSNEWARRESNPHVLFGTEDFKSPASAVPPLAQVVYCQRLKSDNSFAKSELSTFRRRFPSHPAVVYHTP